MSNEMPKALTNEEIFQLKMDGEIVEFAGYDCFNLGMEILFLKEDLKCDKCGKIIKANKPAGMWYFAARHPEKRIIKWACGCIDVDDYPLPNKQKEG